MKAIEIVGIIAVSLVGIGIFVTLITSSVIEYREHKRQEKLFSYLDNYYTFYQLSLCKKTKGSVQFADDIYFVMDKSIPYDKCEELAKLLITIGYYKKGWYEDEEIINR